jgi:tRNA-splicing ligase RtcB
LNKFGLGFSHLFGVEKDFRKWDRILGRIFLGYEAYNLDCKLNNNTSSISHKHNPTQVMVHRKGATLASVGTIGIIPGSMGTKSYIVKGLGNPDSYNSCSHGAGRKMGRKDACRRLNLEEEQRKMEGIVHGMRTQNDLEEAPGSYKNIETVMENQKDLVEVLVELTPLASIKG